MKNKATEIAIFVVGGIGLLIFFTIFYNAPSFIFGRLNSLIQNIIR